MVLGKKAKQKEKKVSPQELEAKAEQPDAQNETQAIPAADDTGIDATSESTDVEAPVVATADQIVTEAADSPEMDKLKDRILRLQADFDNYRKRVAREYVENRMRANQDLIEALLTPVDHLDRALEAMGAGSAEDNPFLQGVKLVRSEFLSTLERFGLKLIEALGQPFDPEQHEALGMVPSDTCEEGNVAAQIRAGYTLNGRLLRATQVVVAAAQSLPVSADADEAAESTDAGGAESPADAEGTEV